VVFLAYIAAWGGAVGIVQQGSGTDDLEVSTFSAGESFRHAVYALNVGEIVYRVGVFVPFPGLVESQHTLSFVSRNNYSN